MGVRWFLITSLLFSFFVAAEDCIKDSSPVIDKEMTARLFDFNRYDFVQNEEEQNNYYALHEVFDYDLLLTINGRIFMDNEFLEIAFNAHPQLIRNNSRKIRSNSTGPNPRDIILSILKRSIKKSAKSLVTDNKTIMIEYGTGGQKVDWKAYANDARKALADKLNGTPDFEAVRPQYYNMLLMSLQQIQTADSIERLGPLRNITINENLQIIGLNFDSIEFRVHCLANKMTRKRKISCTLEEI